MQTTGMAKTGPQASSPARLGSNIESVYEIMQALLQFFDALAQIVDLLAFGIRQLAMLEDVVFGVAHPDDPARDTDYRRVVRHWPHHYRARPDLDIVANRDAAQYLRAGADHDVIADGRVALSLLISGSTQSHSLINQNVIADLRSFTNYHAHSVINEKAAPYFSSGVNLDSGAKI